MKKTTSLLLLLFCICMSSHSQVGIDTIPYCNPNRILRISGYSVSRIFYSPEHSSDSGSDYNPDLRSTLLWKPDINLVDDKEVTVKFYNGDNPSMVRIIAEGITSTGIPVTGKAEYEIK